MMRELELFTSSCTMNTAAPKQGVPAADRERINSKTLARHASKNPEAETFRIKYGFHGSAFELDSMFHSPRPGKTLPS